MELPKFKKEEAKLETLTDKWIYFLKQARKLEQVPETMEGVAVEAVLEAAWHHYRTLTNRKKIKSETAW